MRKEWKQFWAVWWKYARLLPLGVLIALIPFLLNLPNLRGRKAMITGLGAVAIAGLVIPGVVSVCFGLVYAARTQLAIKTGRNIKLSTAVNIVINAVGMTAGVWLTVRLNHRFLNMPATNEAFFGGVVFGGAVIVVLWFYFAYRKAKEEMLALRAKVAESRYHALETQMRPHFLFNALNSLAELIESGREDAAETAYKLSDLYRRILANSGLKTARLDSEIEIVRAYLELEQLRFGPRLQFNIKAPANAEEIFLPSLMMQTLVENAIKHGVAPAVEGGRIEIEIARRPGENYRLRVVNSGAKYRPAHANNGAGLANTRARLDLLYGDRHQFKIESDESGRTVASLQFTGEKID